MSIYATILSIDADDDLAAEGGPTLGAPYVYHSSHRVPSPDDKRDGWVSLASIPAFCGADPSLLVDYLRLDVADAEANTNDVTVLLDRPQVEAIRDTLSAWLTREVEVG